jgi:menaquinone C8-methyltransferase
MSRIISISLAPVALPIGARKEADVHVNFQALRHTPAATLARRVMYGALCGPGWPMRFLPPEEGWKGGNAPHLYVHLPFCRSLCPHCPYVKYRLDEGHQRKYADALLREVAGYLSRTDVPPVQSLYFGGGTPTTTPDIIEAVIAQVAPFAAAGCEVGVEVHPADASREMLERLKRAGVTRISLGIESYRADLLRRLGRMYTPEQAPQALHDARDVGFECVDVNLIFGMPGQGVGDAAADAKRCLDIGVDQISAYQLFTFDHTPAGQHGAMPACGERHRARAERLLSRVCRDGGLERTSPWNYSRPGVPPYSTVTRQDYIGFGVGAGSKIQGVFWFNTFSLDAYIAANPARPALVLQTSERFRRAHWLYWKLYGLRVVPGEYAEEFGRSLAGDYGWALAALTAAGMVRRRNGIWRVTNFGATWMHRLQQLFSLTYIDDMWSRCRDEAWPAEVVLA